MNQLDVPLWAHYASCGCEGLTCWACGQHVEKGQRYYTHGITKLCKLCAGTAVSEWLAYLVFSDKKGVFKVGGPPDRATQTDDSEAS